MRLSQMASSPQYGDGMQRLQRRRVTRAEAERHVRIAHRRVERRRRVLDRIEDGHEVRAVLRRPEERPVAVDRGIALVARDEVVQVMLLVHPVAQRDDDIALDALRPLRLGVRQLAFGDAVGPVAEILDGRPGPFRPAGRSSIGRPARTARGASRPRADEAKCPEAGLDRARRELAELVAADAAVVLHVVEPVGLRSSWPGCRSCRRIDPPPESSASSTSRSPDSSAPPRLRRAPGSP